MSHFYLPLHYRLFSGSFAVHTRSIGGQGAHAVGQAFVLDGVTQLLFHYWSEVGEVVQCE